MGHYERLLEGMDGMPVIDTHSHYNTYWPEPYTLDYVFSHSYVGWLGVPCGGGPAGRQAFLDKVRTNSYYVWLEKALRTVCGMDGPVTADNWDSVSEKLTQAHLANDYDVRFLRDVCGYEKIVHDPHWDPQMPIAHPGFFTPAYRINMFLYGYAPGAADHGGHNAQTVLGTRIRDIDEYTGMMRSAIAQKKAEGFVALKSALAYDRELDYRDVPKERAQKALLAGDSATPEEVRDFQDYVFFRVCAIAAELGLPFQNHTGLGRLRKTNAMQLIDAIERNPDTQFVLFHGGYPWMDDVFALLHNYRNVYPDLCWLPLISPAAAERFVAEAVDVGTADRLCWGCDTWTVEESLGALTGARHVLAKALSHKVEEGYFSIGHAETLARNILYSNAKQLYRL